VSIVVLGLATALAYGTSDFLGGLASRRGESSLAVVAVFKLMVLAVLAAAISMTGEAPAAAAMTWGGIAGLAVGTGYIAYFRGLVVGPMGIVATLAAVWSAVVPLGIGLALGERLTPLAWGGIGVIVIAIPVITYTREPAVDCRGWIERSRAASGGGNNPAAGAAAALIGRTGARLRAAGVLEGSFAGIGFGLFFVALGQASAPGGPQAWPLLAAAAGATVVVGAAALLRRVAWRAALGQWPAIFGAAAVYAAGSWAYISATSLGWISIPAVVAALSPAPTMLLAWLLLGEALGTRQILGIVASLAGVALVTLGLPE
jgi:drug/metabolite transporter (DMT)-like permease